MVAIPTGIISAGFVEQYSKKAAEQSKFNDIEELGEILVTPESELCGKTIEEVQQTFDMRILVVLRGDMTVLAAANLKICKGDILVAASEHMLKSKSATY